MALLTNPSAVAASQQLVQAQAAVGEALAQNRLTVTFNSTGSGSNASVIQPPPSRETFGTLQDTLSIPLPVGHKPTLAVRQAREQLYAAQAQYRASRLALGSQVTTAYFDLLHKQAVAAADQDSLKLAQLQVMDAQKRFRAGDVPQLDVLQAQVPVANAQAALAQAQTQVTVSVETLNDLIGQPLDAPITVADVPAEAPALRLSLEQARASALSGSPNIAAADATVRGNQAALQASRLWQEPTVSLQAIDIRSGDQTSFSREDTVQAEVTVPLSDGGLGRAQKQFAQAMLAQSQAQAAAARKAVTVAVSAAYLNAGGSIAQVAATRTARDIAETTYSKTLLGYRNGLNSLVDVLNEQSAAAQAHIAYIQAVYDAAAAVNSLNAITQGPPMNSSANDPQSSTLAASARPASDASASSSVESPGSTQPTVSSVHGASPADARQPVETPAGGNTTGANTTGRACP